MTPGICEPQQLCHCKYLWQKQEIQNNALAHPNGSNEGQIDYIPVPHRFNSSVYTERTRTFPRPDIASPHDLVMMTFRLRLRRMNNQAPIHNGKM